MSKVKQDHSGIFVVVDGNIVRPYHGKSSFSEGDVVDVAHCSGTPCYGVGKDASCGRGVYLEGWITTGVTVDMKRSEDPKVQEQVRNIEAFYERIKPDYPVPFNEKFRFNDLKKAHRVLVENHDTVILRAVRKS